MRARRAHGESGERKPYRALALKMGRLQIKSRQCVASSPRSQQED